MIAESEAEARNNESQWRLAVEARDWIMVNTLIEQRNLRGWPIMAEMRLFDETEHLYMDRDRQDRILTRHRRTAQRARVEAESATGGGPVWTTVQPPPDPYCGGCGAPTGTPHDDACGAPRWSLVARSVDSDNKPVTPTYCLNIIEALKLRSDVDADVMSRLIRHVAETEMLLHDVMTTLAPMAGYVEESTQGPFARWVCLSLADSETSSTTICEARGRWVWTGGSDSRLQVVARGLGEHLRHHTETQRMTEGEG